MEDWKKEVLVGGRSEGSTGRTLRGIVPRPDRPDDGGTRLVAFR
jgi:hypothetical protein